MSSSPGSAGASGPPPSTPPDDRPPPPKRAATRRRLWFVLRWAIGIGAAAVALDAVFGRANELSGAVGMLEHLSWIWAMVALVAEFGSIVAFAGLQGCLLAAGGLDLGMGPLTGITLAANSIQNSLPVGPAWSTVYAFRQFRAHGADSVLAWWTLLISAVVAFSALGAIALVGLALAQGQAASFDLVEGILGFAAVAVLVVLAARHGVLRGPLRTATVAVVRFLQAVVRYPRGEPGEIVDLAMDRVRAVRLSRGSLASSFGWAAANWLLDLGCLAIAFAAVHSPVPWRGLLLAYGAAQLAANLPVTPGGLGVVEGSLTIALVFYGGAHAATVAAVLLYRIISFWLLLPVGWAAALIIRLRRPAPQSMEKVP
jgi:uncharacterized protein (TIRG00374 family)